MKLLRSMVAGICVLVSTNAFSEESQAMSMEAVQTSMQAKVGLKVLSIADSPVPGLYQLSTARGLFYASVDGNYLLQARVFNVNEGMKNETEEALAAIRLDGVAEFADDAIEFKAKDEKHVITVFTDTTCGYCRKLHNEIGELNDNGITVRYLAFPRSGLTSATYDDMVSVWCSANPQRALTEAKSGESVNTAKCQNTVAQQYQLGQRLGVTGTPNIILEDGTLIPGYQPAQVLIQALNARG